MEKIQASLRALRELFFQQEVQRGRGTEAQSELSKAGKLFLFTKPAWRKYKLLCGLCVFCVSYFSVRGTKGQRNGGTK